MTATQPQTLGEFSLSQLVSALEAKLETCVRDDFTDSTLSLSEIISAEKSVAKAACILRSMRNVLAPINKLPPEILTHVCTLAPGTTPGTIPDFAHLCVQVCRYWRNTLLAFPSLWNEIYPDNPLHVEVHLERSGEVPLEVYVRGALPPARLLRKVVPHLGRVRLLYLSLHAGDDGIFDWLRESEMPLLRSLRFEKASTELRMSASMMEGISSLGVNTTDLILWNVDAHMPSLTFPRLRYFALTTDRGFEGPRVSDMIGFLRGHPMLEELEINRVNYSDGDDAGTHIEPVVLQDLTYARLGGRRSSQSPDSLPYIKVDLLPYLRLPSIGQFGIGIGPWNVTFPRGTNYLLTLIRAWEITSAPGGSLSGGSGFTHFEISLEESPSTLIGSLELWTVGCGSLWVSPDDMVADSRSWSIPNWETTTADESPEAGEADDDEFQAQVSRLGSYLEPLRWSPSPLAVVETLLLYGFGYTRHKGKYLEYLRECFMGLNRVREFKVSNTNPGMVVHLLQPFESESGRMVLLFPLLGLLTFSNCTPVELPRSQFIEVMKKRAGLGNTLEEAWVDDGVIDLSELSGVPETNVGMRVLVR